MMLFLLFSMIYIKRREIESEKACMCESEIEKGRDRECVYICKKKVVFKHNIVMTSSSWLGLLV